jgi:hypothetical protein
MKVKRGVVVCSRGTGGELKKSTAEKGERSVTTEGDTMLTTGECKIIEDHRITMADGAEMIEVRKYFRIFNPLSPSLVTYKISLWSLTHIDTAFRNLCHSFMWYHHLFKN